MILMGKPEKKVHLEDLGVNGILKYIFKKWVWEYGLD
jgi:hypothetical protein